MSKYNIDKTKDIMAEDIKDLVRESKQRRPRSVGAFDHLVNETEVIVTKNLSKSIKSFVEHSLTSDIESYLKDIGSVNKETWKIDVHNVSKVFLEDSKLSCVQDNVSNILDSCVREIQDSSTKSFNDSELDISPLLQPEHIIEVAECMSAGKPLDVRLNALCVLLKSHFTEAVNSEGWFTLQKKLTECLCDNNNEIFNLCLKAHAKLASSSSPVAIKECSLNLLESLGRHYFLQTADSKSISSQSVHFSRMAYLTGLLLDTFSEATLNVARFGDSRLDEMIDNFIQLLSIHAPSKQPRKQQLLSPLEMVSCIDPNGNWLLSITHFNLSRQIFFSSLSKNITFLKLTVEEIVNWLTEPSIPPKKSSMTCNSEINIAWQKFALFSHSLAVLSTICSFSKGANLFPIKISNKEEMISLDEILKMLVAIVNDIQFNDLLHRGSEVFIAFIVNHIAKLLCLQGVNSIPALLILLCDPVISPIKIKVLDKVVSIKSFANPFLYNEMSFKKKIVTFLHHFTSDSCSPNPTNTLTTRQRREIECQGSINLSSEIDTRETSLLEICMHYAVNKLKDDEISKLSPLLIQTMIQVYENCETLLGINFALQAQLIQIVADIYITFNKTLHSEESKLVETDITFNLYEDCTRVLLQNGMSSIGFHLLEKFNVVPFLLRDCLQCPIINWNDPICISFFSKSSSSNNGLDALSSESGRILKEGLFRLWDVIEEDCSGSEMPVEDATKHVLKIISLVSFSLEGVQAMLNESKDGSDVTLTDESDFRPSNLLSLIQRCGLNFPNCSDFIYHHFALNVLTMLISNIDTSIYLQHKFKYQDILLQIQSENRVDENSEVIIDECSVLRQRLIEQHYLPGRIKVDYKPSHIQPRPEGNLAQAKARHRGNGELARWLSETKLGLHDQNWLKHARKLFKNSNLDDMKTSTIQEILDQVVKVLPERKSTIQWQNVTDEDMLSPEERLAVQTIIRYGTHLRLIQPTQQSTENLTHLILLAKKTLNNQDSCGFRGFDWFVSTIYLVCSGNVEKAQTFLSSVSSMQNASILWNQCGGPKTLPQMGHILEMIIAEEMPAVSRVLQDAGLSWWLLCRSWAAQCWWNILDWQQICHWLALSILHSPDHSLYFYAALLHVNHDRLLQLGQENSVHEVIINPVENLQFLEVRSFMDKLHKKYHNMLHSHFGLI